MFRKDINGLRAIAVILVVFYHFNMPFFNGGYIGVDIFFVISGYLMNEICSKTLTDKGWVFSFYKKRINRIYPALLFTCILTAIISIIILPPSFLSDIKNQVLSALTFTSNIYYWKATSGYFTSVASSYLLLHTWSLGVEFQYYLIFPAVIFLANTKLFKGKSYILYGVLAVISFLLCLLVAQDRPSAAFYLLPTRSWELFIGSFASAFKYKNKFSNKTQYISLFAICIFCLFADDSIKWPSIYTLIPVMATALFLHSNISNEKSLLRFPIAQQLGNASYSIYLMHWPLISILYNLGYSYTELSKFIYSLVSIAMGFASYYLIEKKYKVFNRRVAIYSFSLALVCFFSYQFQVSKIWTARDILAMDKFNRGHEHTEEGKLQFGSKPYSCFYTGKGNESFDYEHCLSESKTKRNILLIGDSHMADMSLAFKEHYKNDNIMQATLSSCAVIPNTGRNAECERFTNEVYKHIEKTENLDKVFISAYWADQKNINSTLEKINSAVKIIKEKTNANVYIIGQTKVFEMGLPRTIQLTKFGEVNEYRNKKTDAINKQFKEYFDSSNINYIDIYDIGCENGVCDLISDKGIPMLFDTDHLTHEWAKVALFKISKIADMKIDVTKSSNN